MKFQHLFAELSARAWGLKDRDFSTFFVGSAQRELNLDRDLLDNLVLNRLKRMLHHAEQTSPYYASAFKSYGISFKDFNSIDDIKHYPCLTKDILREKLHELISGGLIESNWSRSNTGGTTSSPVAFYCDDQALWHKNAFTKAIDKWYGKRIGDRVAYLWGARQDIVSSTPTLGSKLRNISYQKSLILPSTPLDKQILASHFKKLSQWKPSFLQAYPTPLYEFCLFMKNNGLRLPSLQAVSVTAETLLQEHRKLIEETLGFPIYNWYGSRELGRISSECEYHDGQHINEPCVYVEIESDPTLPEGCGHLIVTDLWNMATPFIRYRTGDVARFKASDCPCGRPLRSLESLTGRVTDLITLEDGRKIRYSNQLNNKEISELQIIQKTHIDFIVKYVKGSDFSSQTLDSFYHLFCKQINKQVMVVFEETNQIPRARSGKIRLVVNEIACTDCTDSKEEP